MDREESLRIACLVSKGGRMNGEPLLPHEQMKWQGSWRVA